ncbi:hypothetical protein FACS1894120_3080 [Clostridia bacterium]|nr:hypothetical protein FACS1894120_3080 [Clostridia bacterium]
MKRIKNIAAIAVISLFAVQFAAVTAFAAPVTSSNFDSSTSETSDITSVFGNEDLPDVTSAAEHSQTETTQSEPAETTAIPATEGFVDEDIPDNTTAVSDTKSETDTFDLTPPGGEATVIENEIQGNREFFTFKTPAGNVFYLVIERDKQSENVYFLNDVTESDLIALTADEKDKNVGNSNLFKQKTDEENTDDADGATDDKDDKKADNQPAKSNISTYLIGGVALVAFIIIAYYFKVVKPKKSTEFEDEDLTDEDENSGNDDESDYEKSDVNFEEERD